MTDIKGSISADVDIRILHKEWDEISCPICMDHPHNAVLLICSSYEKGCRSYICDTSYRHSNCLDRFKSLGDSPLHTPHIPGNSERLRHGQGSLHPLSPEPDFDIQRVRSLTGTHEDFNLEEGSGDISTGLLEALEEASGQEPAMVLVDQGQERIDLQESDGGTHMSEKNNGLKCPLCRGTLLSYRIEKEVRQYLDLKPRSCSRELCTFSGSYRDLRRHARRVHPATRPADVDPSRQHAWRCLEREREIGDVVSALRSISPGAIVIGDYMVDSGDGLLHDRDSSGSGGDNRSWWTTFFLLQMLRGPLGPLGEPRSSSRSWRTHRRPRHRNVWDVDFLDLQDDENNDGFLDSDDFPVPRRRRRFMRSRTDDDGPER